MGKSIWLRRAAAAATGVPLVIAALATGLPAATAEEVSPPFTGVAAAQLRFRAIKVDASPLAEKGLGPEAAWIAEDLPVRLREAFAARMAPRDAAAPTLVVRIDLIYLGPSGGGGTQPFDGSAARDNIEGVGMVVAPNGKTIAAFPLFSTLLAFTGGSAHEMGTERGRVAVLASSFAQWLPGKMGL
jgi:hypothetical protein